MFVDDMYLKSINGKYVKIIFIASSVEQANHFMETNQNTGVLKEVGHLVFIANNDDLGKNEIQ